ncbi:hypothetical protein RB195_006870 [Necator americanus]|uniref:Uncharacterized protein n=1 Tax=Necator americanus TaxID=51031 RepID=A0ABR1BUL5_NECAM
MAIYVDDVADELARKKHIDEETPLSVSLSSTTMSTSSLGDEAANFNIVWEVEANGKTKILEAKERRMRRIQEAHYLAQIETERYREEKEAEFKVKCQSFNHEDEERNKRLIRNVELELDYMEARVELCKPVKEYGQH